MPPAFGFLTASAYSFLVAYGLFEVPSNILLKKLRPSRWIAFLMFAWGAVRVQPHTRTHLRD